MTEKLALPLLLSNPPPTKPSLPIQTHLHHQQLKPTTPPSPPPQHGTPLMHDFLFKQSSDHSKPFTSQTQPDPFPIPRARTRIGKARDRNRGKPWTHHRLSLQGQRVLDSLNDPSFESSELDKILSLLLDYHKEELSLSSGGKEGLSNDVLGVIKGLGFYKKRDLAMSVFEWFKNRNDCGSVLSNSAVAVIISMLGKEGKVSVAAALLNDLHKDGFELDVYAYTSLITACVSNGRYREAVTVFKNMEEEGCKPTLITYNVILNVYGKMGMPWNKIKGLFEGMKNAGVLPDEYTYNTLITCCRRGSLHEEAAAVFKDMKLMGFVPDKVTYNALLDVYGKSRRTKEAMEVLREMEVNGCSPSIVTYNSLISAYARDGLLKEAMELKNQMVEGGIKLDVFHLHYAFVRICQSWGKFAEMMKVFEDIKNSCCVPDIVTWNTLLAVFGQNGMDSEVSGVFKEMKRAGFVPERDTYNTLISAYSRCGSFDQAMAIYKRMLEAGITPDLSTYNAVLAALARGGLWEQSEKILAEMKDGRCKPNELTYCSLLHAYANGKEIGRMLALAEEICSGVIEPHAVLLKTLVLVNSKCDLLIEAEVAFLELKRKGFSPDLSTLNAMLSIYGRRQMFTKTNEILNFMNESGFTPSLATYNSLMYMHSRSENFERSEEVLKEILAKGIKPDIISYNTVIFAYCRNGRMKEASRIFSEMRESGLVPDVITYNTFVASYSADSMFEDAIDVVRYMIKHGCKPNQNTYNSVVDGYCKHNHRDDAIMFISSLHELDPHISREEKGRHGDMVDMDDLVKASQCLLEVEDMQVLMNTSIWRA
ncbi:hypothetical protein OIU78_018637 [Salix suchowensis]|nr:hypothetical protein OIU78_018637 [Salix suchowensis]